MNRVSEHVEVQPHKKVQ